MTGSKCYEPLSKCVVAAVVDVVVVVVVVVGVAVVVVSMLLLSLLLLLLVQDTDSRAQNLHTIKTQHRTLCI